MTVDVASAGLLARHRRERLAATLRFIRSASPLYRALLAGREIDEATGPEALAGLPVLDGAEWERRRGELRTGALDARSAGIVVGFTSGTSGEPRSYLTTEAERAALTAALAPSEGGRALNLVGVNHGLQTPRDQAPGTVTVPLVDPGHYAHAAYLLERDREPYRDMPLFETVTGSLRAVKQLSLYLLRRHETLAALGVRRLHVYRQMLSPGWRARLEQWWGAKVDSSYGASELSAIGFMRCTDCAHHHAAPSGLVEVLDPDTLRPVPPGGRGAVVVTAFHPFVELEPRIRYRPGDLADVAGRPCPRWGELGFVPVGRQRDAVRVDGRWLTPADVMAALGDLVDVNVRLAWPLPDARQHESGSPRFNLAVDEAGRAVVRVELRYDPLVWAHEAARVREHLAARLGADVLVALHGPEQLPGEPCFA